MDWNNINTNRDTSGLGPIEYDQTKVPALIRKHADNVRTKTYGQEVREAQARNAEYAGLIAQEAKDTSSSTEARQDSIDTRYDVAVGAMTEDAEILDARVSAHNITFPNLKTRLDNQEYFFNAKNFGAVGDGVTDDTANLQRAIDFANLAGGGTVYIPTGIYMVDPTYSESGKGNLYTYGGLHLKSNVHLYLEPTTIIRAISNGKEAYNLIRSLYDDENVGISGGIFEGDKDTHDFTASGTHEWGYGYSLQGCKNVRIENARFQHFTGDGINLQVGYDGTSFNYPIDNVYINNVVSDGNRRQGMSIESGTKIVVRDSTFSNTKGTLPESGIDIEPWDIANKVNQVLIDNCRFENNNKGGVISFGKAVSDVTVSNSTFVNNGGDGDLIINGADGDIRYINNIARHASITRTSDAILEGNTLVFVTINASSEIDVNNNKFQGFKAKITGLGTATVEIPNYDSGSYNIRFKGNSFIGNVYDSYVAVDYVFNIGSMSRNIIIDSNIIEKYHRLVSRSETATRTIIFKNNHFKNIKIPPSDSVYENATFISNIFEGLGYTYYTSLISNRSVAFGNIAYKRPLLSADKISGFSYTTTDMTISPNDAKQQSNLFVDNASA